MPDLSEQFSFDVFLSHSTKDRDVVRDIAERLRGDGLRVWFDEWEIKPKASKAARERKIEDGLERSRVLVLCMSANAFGSDWAQLEAGTFRFRDPLNKERRFLLLRLDYAAIKSPFDQGYYIEWIPEDGYELTNLLDACRPATQKSNAVAKLVTRLDYKGFTVPSYSFSRHGSRALTGTDGRVMRLWDAETGHSLRVFEGHSSRITKVEWSSDQFRALSCSLDHTVRIWAVETGQCLEVLEGHTDAVLDVAWSRDNNKVISSAQDNTVRLWSSVTGRCVRVLQLGYPALRIALSRDCRHVLACTSNILDLRNVVTGSPIRAFTGHTDRVRSMAWSSDERFALSGGEDMTIRLWNVNTGQCLRIFDGHTDSVSSLTWSADSKLALSGDNNGSIRLWDVETGRCLCVFHGHNDRIVAVAWSADGRLAFSGDSRGEIRIWSLPEFVSEVDIPDSSASGLPFAPDQVQYTNAKVLLVGESGVGKTGLSKRLATGIWEPSDSTVGAWATHWKLPVSTGQDVEKEIWLWDFGGQADQRLIHQLYMDETALAILVFDGQKEDLFETLAQWDRDLARASRNPFSKLLVAGRVDTGGLRLSRSEIKKFAMTRRFRGFLETSAKRNSGCEELRQAILEGINWDELPCRTTEVLFKHLKEEIIAMKEEGRVLLRFNELREMLQMRLSRKFKVFSNEDLRAVLTLLAGPGVVWELEFGSWVLLQPERINAYAQAVIRTLQADEYQRGCLMEERVLKGDLMYQSSMERLEGDEERFVLLAMHQTLVERGLCLREHTEQGTMLVFPSYYRRERPELVGHPAALVSYRFNGFLDDIYATLVVRLHHTASFRQDQLWRYAADFKTLTGKQLGVKLERRAEGAGEILVYADPAIADEQKILFSRYVHEHILGKSRDLVRLRHYACPHCGTQVGNREVAMKRLSAWLENRPITDGLAGKIKGLISRSEGPTILCSDCEKRVPLWDALEQYFASEQVKARVRKLQEESDLILGNESKDRALVAEVISTVSLAGQIIEEYSAKRFGLDMEIEFRDDNGTPTAKKIYLQLKSGDSHLKKRSDGTEVFQIHHKGHAIHWMNQAYPVCLVIANSKGEVRWMEVRDWLKQASDNGKKPVKQIVFEGERFDVMSVRRWRERVL